MEAINDRLLRRAEEREKLYNSELKKQVRSWETYFDQLGNILVGVARFSGWWVACTTIYAAAIALLLFMYQDFSAYSYSDMRQGLRFILIICGGVAAVAGIFSNVGRFSNIFHFHADNYAARYQNFQKQVETIESVLIKHDLIKESDITARQTVDNTQK